LRAEALAVASSGYYSQMRADLLADASCPEIGTSQSFQNLFQFHDVLTLSTAFSTLVLTKRRAKSCIKLEIRIDPQKTLILFELFTKGVNQKLWMQVQGK
jgi:hypothetical protein